MRSTTTRFALVRAVLLFAAGALWTRTADAQIAGTWIEDDHLTADGSGVSVPSGTWIREIGTWIEVPYAPQAPSDLHEVAIWTGLQPTAFDGSVLQPVLQFIGSDTTQAGWSMQDYWVYKGQTAWQDTAVRVQTGDWIQLEIWDNCPDSSGVNCQWNIGWYDWTSGASNLSLTPSIPEALADAELLVYEHGYLSGGFNPALCQYDLPPGTPGVSGPGSWQWIFGTMNFVNGQPDLFWQPTGEPLSWNNQLVQPGTTCPAGSYTCPIVFTQESHVDSIPCGNPNTYYATWAANTGYIDFFLSVGPGCGAPAPGYNGCPY
ncbi:MAG TPA: hypothetical protein VE987_01070 [Polyangiaceae bacterium]|nr:hypothetical protein [Polyangiaceae bacterium]